MPDDPRIPLLRGQLGGPGRLVEARAQGLLTALNDADPLRLALQNRPAELIARLAAIHRSYQNEHGPSQTGAMSAVLEALAEEFRDG